MCWLALHAVDPSETENPFEDEIPQCKITISPDMMSSLEAALQTKVQCDGDLWDNFLLHYHQTHQNLTECVERASGDDSPDTANETCQQLLDDVQRQMEQEHRKQADGLEQQLHAAQMETKKQLNEKVTLQREINHLLYERNELVLELLLANIAIGDIKQALANYRVYRAKTTDTKLQEQIVRSVYRVTMYQDQRLLNLINFVQQLDNVEAKLILYRLMMVEIQKRPAQRNGYIAAVFALAVKADQEVYAAEQRLYTDLMVPIETRWKEQLANGNYKEVIEFAIKQPKYYEQMQTNLATVDKDKWAGLNFAQFVPYLNSLPKAMQRLEALKQIMAQIRERNKQNPKAHLVLTAKQVDICEQFMNKTKANQNDVIRALNNLKGEFVKFTPGKDYNYYLAESRKASG
uniref:Uncharacterized protein n=1 Tax=Anopheles culicifacies TaxID=139723 RepID=A0A2C9GUM2_9DIPT